MLCEERLVSLGWDIVSVLKFSVTWHKLGKVKIQSRLDFIVIVCILITVISVILFVADLT